MGYVEAHSAAGGKAIYLSAPGENKAHLLLDDGTMVIEVASGGAVPANADKVICWLGSGKKVADGTYTGPGSASVTVASDAITAVTLPGSGGGGGGGAGGGGGGGTTTP